MFELYGNKHSAIQETLERWDDLTTFNHIHIAKHQPEYFNPNNIKNVIFNDPATIVIWQDGTKTVVKCQKDKGDTYNPEHGLAMCIIKKMCGNKGSFNNIFTKWLPKE